MSLVIPSLDNKPGWDEVVVVLVLVCILTNPLPDSLHRSSEIPGSETGAGRGAAGHGGNVLIFIHLLVSGEAILTITI